MQVVQASCRSGDGNWLVHAMQVHFIGSSLRADCQARRVCSVDQTELRSMPFAAIADWRHRMTAGPALVKRRISTTCPPDPLEVKHVWEREFKRREPTISFLFEGAAPCKSSDRKGSSRLKSICSSSAISSRALQSIYCCHEYI
jgi:hypothetical protein